MKFAIMGSGGVGGFFGARLAAAGLDTHFIARGTHLAAMRSGGLEVLSPAGDFHVEPVQATDDPATIGPVDCVLFATKLWDLADAALACRPLIGPDTGVISLHNGVSAEEDIGNVLGPTHVLGGVAEITSFVERPGVIAHRGNFARIRFGEMDGRQSARTEHMLEAFTKAGIETELSQDIGLLLWLKYVVIVGTSGMTSLTRQGLGPIRNTAETRALLAQAFDEVIAVGTAKGVAFDSDVGEERMAFVDTLPETMTSSMANDLTLGQRLELEWFAGNLVRMGQALGVPTPLNGLIYNLLKLNANGRDTS
ncbi:MAG: 2-dehydropantoate 2-reductase [Alphaproteobacteria bacterium]|nr:2-dehydropantoate 2-reductase [Alphaproteobacteria bacterium]